MFVSDTLEEDQAGPEEGDDYVPHLYYCACQVECYELKTNRIGDFVSNLQMSRTQVGMVSRSPPMSSA